MKKSLLCTGLLILAGCSSTPKYEKMRTADEALNQYDQNVVKDGMAITKKGSVIDIKIEEVQAQRNRLQVEVEEKDKKIEFLNDKIRDMEREISSLRVELGLSAQKPQAEGKCCTPDGKLIPGTIKPAPSLDEELAVVRQKRAVKREKNSEEESGE